MAEPGPRATDAAEGITGRVLVLCAADAAADTLAAIKSATGLRVTLAPPEPDALVAATARGEAGVLLGRLGVAVVEPAPDQATALARAVHEPGPILAVEPERVVHAFADAPEPDPEPEPQPPVDETEATWGLHAVGAAASPLSGAGVAVAVLDTGLDLTHPDIAPERLEAASFVPDQDVQDGHGHGTHCIGTACGPKLPREPPRYGIAHGARIYAGKVLSNTGSGTDGGILEGIEWAVRGDCRIVSMSLGARARPGEPYSRVFEAAAQRALRQGTILVAAAGNDSVRTHGYVLPVAHPANCPSILAVGAVDEELQVASFSNRSGGGQGGQVDFVAPGVDVRSSWPAPARYRELSGTSMATPHVAGVLALMAESDPGARAGELVARAFTAARRLPLSSEDAGAGLIRVP